MQSGRNCYFSFVAVQEGFAPYSPHSILICFDIILHDDVGIVFCSKRRLNKNKQTKILVDMHFVVKSNFSSLDPVSSKSWLVLQQFTQQKLKVKSETSTFTFLQNKLSQPRLKFLKGDSSGAPASCQLLSSHHHWSSAPPSPRAPPRRPMPPNLNSIEWIFCGGWGLSPVPWFQEYHQRGASLRDNTTRNIQAWE